MLESCVYNLEGLPDRKVFSACHNIVAGTNAILSIFTVFIYSRSPKSKESSVYKGIIISQFLFLFISMFLWSSSFKFYADFRSNLIYIEGFVSLLGVNCGQAYGVCCFLFGFYGSLILISYIYRLYIISHPKHIVRKRFSLASMSLITFTLGSVLPTLLFSLAYFADFTIPNNPLRKLSLPEREMLIRKGVIWYPIMTTRGLIYCFYFGSILVALAIAIVISCLEIARQLYIKQIISSATTKKYHIHVLKSLIIQSVFTVFIITLAPFIMLLRLIFDLSPCLVEFAMVLMGTSFTVHTSILILFNQNLRQTVIRLFFLDRTRLEIITARSSKVIPR